MISRHNETESKRDYLGACAISLAAAGFFTIFFEAESLPGIGHAPLLPIVAFAACLGFPFLMAVQKLGPVNLRNTHLTIGIALKLMALGLALAIPPIAIDIYAPFPRDMNVQLPAALLFYPAIALVADVLFHLLPLALLSSLSPRNTPVLWIFLPAVFFEPLLQAFWVSEDGGQSWLVFANVGLVSATQLWLFRNYGFGAMIALRVSFYLFWHVIWAAVRQEILF